MKAEKQQTELLNNLFHSIKLELMIGDFQSSTEMIDYVTNKVKNVAYDADNYGYNEARTIAEDVAKRVDRLKGIRKSYQIPNRIQDIITNIKY